MGHRIFAGGTFLVSCCSASLKFLISPRARGIVQNALCSAWHLVLVWVSACAVTYGSCEGDINWEARVSFHGSVCVLLGKARGFVV